jgi:hypothetical protein
MGVYPRRKMLVVVEVQSSKSNALENPQNWVSSPLPKKRPSDGYFWM